MSDSSERRFFDLRGDFSIFHNSDLVAQLDSAFSGTVLYILAFGTKHGDENTQALLLAREGVNITHYQHGEEERRREDISNSRYLNSVTLNIIVTKENDFLQTMGLDECRGGQTPPCPSHALSKSITPVDECAT